MRRSTARWMNATRLLLGCLAAAIVMAAPTAYAQPPRPVPIVGYLGGTTAQGEASALAAFRGGLREGGYVEGETVIVHYRWAEGHSERYPDFVHDILRLNPTVLVSQCGPALQAIREASRTIPVVVASCMDPAHFVHGEIASLARPGGQTTGFTFLAPEATGKRFELLKEIVPRLARVAVLQNTEPWTGYWNHMRRNAAPLGLTLHRFEVENAGELERTFAAMQRDRVGAIVVLTDILMFSARGQIADLARRHRIPTAFDLRAFVLAGGLLSYAAPAPDLYRGAGDYVARILKGARPGDLPIQQPTRFELSVNVKTAKALGLRIVPSLLLRANEVIE